MTDDERSLIREYEIIKQEYETLKAENDIYRTLYGELTPDTMPYMVGDIVIDPILMQVRVSNKLINITNTEFKVLYYMTKHKNNVVSKKQLIALIGCGNERTRTADAHISSIRKKLDPYDKYRYIKTIRDSGYIFEDYTDGYASDEEDED